jgi:methylmalonyl-CoA mutase cobalamin-binding domain/chain
MTAMTLKGSAGQATERTVRVLVAKVGLDGHDRGVKIVARSLRDAGLDVIYTGLHRTPEQVVEAAVQEDVDVLGLSILSGAHMTIFPRVIALLKEHQADDIALVGGGVMPDEDVRALLEMGVAAILGQNTTPEQIVETVTRLASARHAAQA